MIGRSLTIQSSPYENPPSEKNGRIGLIGSLKASSSQPDAYGFQTYKSAIMRLVTGRSAELLRLSENGNGHHSRVVDACSRAVSQRSSLSKVAKIRL